MRGSIGIHVDITERREAEEELKETRSKLNRYKNGLAALNSVTSNLSLSLKDQITQGLEIATNYLGQELGIVSEVKGSDYQVLYFHSNSEQFKLELGAIFPLTDTMCEAVMRTSDQLAIKNITESNFNKHPCHDKFGIESYLGINYRVNDMIRGTVNFSSAKHKEEDFDTYDLEFVDLFAK